jgi:hypothetical protein
MKKICLFIWGLSLAASPLASADLKTLAADGVSKAHSTSGVKLEASAYGDLATMFDKATEPAPSDLRGWNTGRCFMTTAPDTAINALLVGAFAVAGDDKGPLFPPVANLKIIHLVTADEGADYFDSMPSDKESSIASYIRSTHSYITYASVIDGSLTSRNLNGNLEYRIRKSGNILFERATVATTDSIYKAGDAHGYCYYFKKVHE